MAEAQRAAGARSGVGAAILDGSKPLSGLLGETLRREPRPPSTPAPFAGSIASDPGPHRAVLRASRSEPELIGGVPRPGLPRQMVALPGYKGHVQGKVAENVHGGTFRAENERAVQSLPLQRSHSSWAGYGRQSAQPVARSATGATRAMKMAPTVPGYMGAIPGKDAETVHGVRMAQAARVAATIRDEPPVTEAHSWLKRGVWPVDRMATYKWSNRFSKINLDPIFTRQEDDHAFASTRDLGTTFGIKAEVHSLHRPGDRHLHTMLRAGGRRRVDVNAPAAGQPSISAYLDQERWRSHCGHFIGGANQRCAY